MIRNVTIVRAISNMSWHTVMNMVIKPENPISDMMSFVFIVLNLFVKFVGKKIYLNLLVKFRCKNFLEKIFCFAFQGFCYLLELSERYHLPLLDLADVAFTYFDLVGKFKLCQAHLLSFCF